MTNIIIFPGKAKEEAKIHFEELYQKPDRLVRIKAFTGGVLRFFQCILVLGWPIIRWFVYLDLLLAFLRMISHTSPHASLMFALHCTLIITTAWFVFIYRADSSLSLKRQAKNHNLSNNKRKQCCYKSRV